MFQKGNKQSIKRIKNITTAKILHFVILANKSAIFITEIAYLFKPQMLNGPHERYIKKYRRNSQE